MHTLTISLQGAANDTTSAEFSDAEALPVYVKLKEALLGAKAPRKATRKETIAPSALDPTGNGDQARGLAADAETDR